MALKGFPELAPASWVADPRDAGYPLFYRTGDHRALCHVCAMETDAELKRDANPARFLAEMAPVDAFINYEHKVKCCSCSGSIGRAYQWEPEEGKHPALTLGSVGFA
jgi:hypothetical protein